MWTLKHEIFLYFLLPFLLYFGRSLKNAVFYLFVFFLVLALASKAAGFYLINIPCCRGWVLSSNEYASFITFSAYFFSGALYFKYKDKVIISGRIFVLCSLFFVLCSLYGSLNIVLFFIFPYVVLYLGVVWSVNFFSRFGDYSYGMYIYAFPIQQLIVMHFNNDISVFGLFMWSFIITFFVSVLSWHYFESAFLKFKPN